MSAPTGSNGVLSRPSVVFDCNVYLQATVQDFGPAFACLQSFLTGGFSLFVSPRILSEIESVFSRPELRRKFRRLTEETTDALLETLVTQGILVYPVPPVFAYERDPDDAHYVNLAAAAGARYLVSRDRDLLDLMDENRAEARDFRQRFPDLTILDPVEFLKILPGAPPLVSTS